MVTLNSIKGLSERPAPNAELPQPQIADISDKVKSKNPN